MNSSSSASLLQRREDECAGVMWFLAAFAFKRSNASTPDRLDLAMEYLDLERKSEQELKESGAGLAKSVTIQIVTPEKQPRNIRQDQIHEGTAVQGTPSVEMGTTWKSVWKEGP